MNLLIRNKLWLAVWAALSLFSSPVLAQDHSVKVKTISLHEGQTASVSIRKDKIQRKKSTTPEFKIIQGSREVEGDPSASSKGALQNWKTACSEWKDELKELNKTNEIIALDCGKPIAGKADYQQKIYHSNGSYQIKVRMKAQVDSKSSSLTEDVEDDEDEDDDESDDTSLD